MWLFKNVTGPESRFDVAPRLQSQEILPTGEAPPCGGSNLACLVIQVQVNTLATECIATKDTIYCVELVTTF